MWLASREIPNLSVFEQDGLTSTLHRGYDKTCFMLNSAEHEISTAPKPILLNLGREARKSVFRVSNQVIPKPACSAIETS